MPRQEKHLDEDPLTGEIEDEIYVQIPLLSQSKALGLRSGIAKPKIRRMHTGWAIAVGKKQAEKVGAPLHKLFFETKPQDPNMLMRRPLFPRPDTPPHGALSSDDINGTTARPFRDELSNIIVSKENPAEKEIQPEREDMVSREEHV